MTERHTHTPKEMLRELRVALHLQVVVWGLGKDGKPFSATADTVEISAFGARLKTSFAVHEGEVLGIRYLDQKARFRVIWVGAAGTDREGQIGVQSLDESRCIWQEALESEAAKSAAAGAAISGSASGDPRLRIETRQEERRRYPRHRTNANVEVRRSGSTSVSLMRMADISLGGCYAETMAPLPVDTRLDMTLKIAGTELPIKAVVRTSHPAMGMGLGFTEIDPENWKVLAHIIHELSGGTREITAVSARKAERDATIEAAVSMLLRLLEEKGVISREALMAQMRSSRS